MLKYILKRLGFALITLLGVSLILYILLRCMPVDFIESKIAAITAGGQEVSQDVIKAMYETYGLADSSFFGIIKGYGSWLWSLVHFDFGTAFLSGASVLDDITSRMGVSFSVAFIAIIFEYLIAIPLGVTAATHQYSIRDYVVTIFVMIGISLPSFFFGRVIQNLFALQLEWFPFTGLPAMPGEGAEEMLRYIGEYLRCIFLPVLVMVVLSIGGTMRYMRTNMLEVLNSDYIRTARAKGLKESKVIYKHAFRNTMIPIVTMLAGVLPTLFSGAMITEQVFNLDGIGNYALKATMSGDIPFIMTYNMFLAFLSVIGVLLSDLMYVVVDPRVKLS